MAHGQVDGPRGAAPADLPGVIALVDAAMRVGSDQTMLTDYPLVYAAENLANVQLIAVDGRPVSTVPVLPRDYELAGCRLRVGIISPTATDPAHQHRGYGHRNLGAIIERMRGLGCELSILWTQVATFPFYERMGWGAISFQGVKRTCRREDAILFRGRAPITAGQLDPTETSQVEAVCAMHAADADQGTVRSVADSGRLLALPNMRTLLALDGGHPTAYLIVSRAINKPGLIEAGGDRAAIEGLVGLALGGLSPGEQVDLHTQPSRMVFERVLEHALPDRSEVAISHQMVRVNDLRALLVRLAPELERRNHGQNRSISLEVVETGETVSLVFEGSEVTVGHDRVGDHIVASRAEWGGILFGSHPERVIAVPDVLASLVPFDLPVWMLDRS